MGNLTKHKNRIGPTWFYSIWYIKIRYESIEVDSYLASVL